MPLLSCSAEKCIYNTDHYCSKGDIMVTGEEAEKACETCCSSFRERGENSASNSVGEPSKQVLVGCSACNCRYNDEEACHAEKIDICGPHAERGENSASNSVGEPSKQVLVGCSACNCRYNDEEACHAEKIDICGPHACQCRQTECGTFDKAW